MAGGTVMVMANIRPEDGKRSKAPGICSVVTGICRQAGRKSAASGTT